MTRSNADTDWMLDGCARTEGTCPNSDCGSCTEADGPVADADDFEHPVVGLTPWSLEPEFSRTDWDLLRKFNTFWPRGCQGPPDMPWLGQLVSRKKAWRWASQFPRLLKDVEPEHTQVILGFVARTLTQVEPPSPSSEAGDKKCCEKRVLGPESGGNDDCWPQFVTCAEYVLDFEGKPVPTGGLYISMRTCCLTDEGIRCSDACGPRMTA